ncbi:hypothetical protein D9M71_679440 [compost metagenome]
MLTLFLAEGHAVVITHHAVRFREPFNHMLGPAIGANLKYPAFGILYLLTDKQTALTILYQGANPFDAIQVHPIAPSIGDRDGVEMAPSRDRCAQQQGQGQGSQQSTANGLTLEETPGRRLAW